MSTAASAVPGNYTRHAEFEILALHAEQHIAEAFDLEVERPQLCSLEAAAGAAQGNPIKVNQETGVQRRR